MGAGSPGADSTTPRELDLKPETLQFAGCIADGFVSETSGAWDGEQGLQTGPEVIRVDVDRCLHRVFFAANAAGVNFTPGPWI